MVTIRFVLEAIPIILGSINLVYIQNISTVFNKTLRKQTLFIILVVLGIIDLFLIAYFLKLLILHFYLKREGITTYQYIMKTKT